MRFHIARTIVKHFRSSAVVEGSPLFLQGSKERNMRDARAFHTFLWRFLDLLNNIHDWNKKLYTSKNYVNIGSLHG